MQQTAQIQKCKCTHHILNKNECWKSRSEILEKWDNLTTKERQDYLLEAGATEQQFLEFGNSSLDKISKLMSNGQEIAAYCFWIIGGLEN